MILIDDVEVDLVWQERGVYFIIGFLLADLYPGMHDLVGNEATMLYITTLN